MSQSDSPSQACKRRSEVGAHDPTELFNGILAAGVDAYRRDRHLPRLLPVGPEEIGDLSSSGRKRILAHLARALRAERNRGRVGHWTYDLNRHIALAQAYESERRLLKQEPPPNRI